VLSAGIAFFIKKSRVSVEGGGTRWPDVEARRRGWRQMLEESPLLESLTTQAQGRICLVTPAAEASAQSTVHV
jgi:hypothetical protein